MDRGISGLGPAGILAALVIVLAGNVSAGGVAVLPLGALLALAWARLSGTPWRDLGYVYWEREREVSHLFWK